MAHNCLSTCQQVHVGPLFLCRCSSVCSGCAVRAPPAPTAQLYGGPAVQRRPGPLLPRCVPNCNPARCPTAVSVPMCEQMAEGADDTRCSDCGCCLHMPRPRLQYVCPSQAEAAPSGARLQLGTTHSLNPLVSAAIRSFLFKDSCFRCTHRRAPAAAAADGVRLHVHGARATGWLRQRRAPGDLLRLQQCAGADIQDSSPP